MPPTDSTTSLAEPLIEPSTEKELMGLDDIEAQVQAYERQQRRKLGLDDPPRQWSDPEPRDFAKHQRVHTTILFGGLTVIQDRLIEVGLSSLGYRMKALDCPDNDALRYGKEFGNRGQCNPAYYTVGNLVKHLVHLRDEQGISTDRILKEYLFLTAGACGPCRFGMYATEYRKALRDAGFAGFRVLLFKNTGGFWQSSKDAGIALTPKFFLTLLKCILAGDVINLMGYRIRPYETDPGSTDNALEQCRFIVSRALRKQRSIIRALFRCRKILKNVQVNRMQPKPKVTLIGEFWAMTTEGDGNYHLQRFLESEGAECDVQPVSNWIFYLIWEASFETREHMMLRREDGPLHGLDYRSFRKLLLMRLARMVLARAFHSFAFAIGLKNYHLTNMDEIARISHAHYLNQLRGGEGHMEVGKLIQSVTKNKAHMVVSIKPFGCMPSSGVSDGVQSLITAKYPEANFLAIETSGDGAVNVYSRVQMALFKARKKAQKEFDQALEHKGMDIHQVTKSIAENDKLQSALYYARHVVAGTAANTVYALW